MKYIKYIKIKIKYHQILYNIYHKIKYYQILYDIYHKIIYCVK